MHSYCSNCRMQCHRAHPSPYGYIKRSSLTQHFVFWAHVNLLNVSAGIKPTSEIDWSWAEDAKWQTCRMRLQQWQFVSSGRGHYCAHTESAETTLWGSLNTMLSGVFSPHFWWFVHKFSSQISIKLMFSYTANVHMPFLRDELRLFKHNDAHILNCSLKVTGKNVCILQWIALLPQQDGRWFKFQSVWGLLVLPVSAWIFPGYFISAPPSKNHALRSRVY